MSVNSMHISELRKALNAVITGLNRPVFITQRGRIRAVLLDIDRYNQMLDALEDAQLACDPGVRQAVIQAQAAGADDWVSLDEALPTT